MDKSWSNSSACLFLWWADQEGIVYRIGLHGITASSLAVDYCLLCASGFVAWLEEQQAPGPLRIPGRKQEQGH